jgi:hypothetical protein
MVDKSFTGRISYQRSVRGEAAEPGPWRAARPRQPRVFVLDEIQELFSHSDHGKEAGEIATTLSSAMETYMDPNKAMTDQVSDAIASLGQLMLDGHTREARAYLIENGWLPDSLDRTVVLILSQQAVILRYIDKIYGEQVESIKDILRELTYLSNDPDEDD